MTRLFFFFLLLSPALFGRAEAACNPMISGLGAAGLLHLASDVKPAPAGGTVGLSFVGHATFIITSPGGVTIATDYNDQFRPGIVPDIATMNHAHLTHYTDTPDPGIKLVLRGWDLGKGPQHYDVSMRDVHIRSLATDIRNYMTGTMEANGNSVFVFETGSLCIAHLGHLHQVLTPEDVAALGQVDVLLAPVDGTWTLNLDDMAEVIRRLKAPLVIPFHYFGHDPLDRFLAKEQPERAIVRNPTDTVQLYREMLPTAPTIMVLNAY